MSAEKNDNTSPIIQPPDLQELLGHTNEIVPHPRPDLVAAYRVIQDRLQPDTGIIYHPCNADDISPSVAFPKSRVIYVEWDSQVVEGSLAHKNVVALKAAGQEAYFADARVFNPGIVDIVILRNPIIASDGPVSHLKSGGYALVNDYHGNASELYKKDDEFELIGIVHSRTPNKEPILDTASPELYWERVETDEELQATPDYPGLVIMTKPQTGTERLTLEIWQATLNRLREEYPDAKSMDGMLVYGSPNLRFFPESLPHKKGHMDDIFVFRRKPLPGIS
ncbi:MAG: hypothetical protein QG675_298 [Patescibacteria group bacterium]|nr:hypothetical protein [Patescibacteria group bacterium]